MPHSLPAVNIETVELLLLVAATVIMLARRLGLPYTVVLVAAGALIALTPISTELHLTSTLIFQLFLPPLVFEAALFIPWPELRRDFVVVALLATVGVLVATALMAFGMHFLCAWSLPAALVFGILISATDPVSVIATFKEAGVHGRLRLLVEAESLFNDGTAAVGFALALLLLQGASVGLLGMLQAFSVNVALAVGCGALIGGAIILIAGRTEDHLVEITLTTVAAFGSFLLAERFHLSGVLATLTAGIMIGNVGSLGSISDRGREALEAFWEYAAFVANALIFLLMGVSLTHEHFVDHLPAAVAAICLALGGRAVAVYGCNLVFARSRWKVEMRHQHILFWGGLRGALALGLVLSLPVTTPHYHALRTVAFAVVAFSIIVQGLTIQSLLRRLNLVD